MATHRGMAFFMCSLSLASGLLAAAPRKMQYSMPQKSMRRKAMMSSPVRKVHVSIDLSKSLLYLHGSRRLIRA